MNSAASAEELSETLTAREREVLDLLGHGLSNKLIGRELHISEHTVKFHISSSTPSSGSTTAPKPSAAAPVRTDLPLRERSSVEHSRRSYPWLRAWMVGVV